MTAAFDAPLRRVVTIGWLRELLMVGGERGAGQVSWACPVPPPLPARRPPVARRPPLAKQRELNASAPNPWAGIHLDLERAPAVAPYVSLSLSSPAPPPRRRITNNV